MSFQELCLLCYETPWLLHSKAERVGKFLLFQLCPADTAHAAANSPGASLLWVWGVVGKYSKYNTPNTAVSAPRSSEAAGSEIRSTGRARLHTASYTMPGRAGQHPMAPILSGVDSLDSKHVES